MMKTVILASVPLIKARKLQTATEIYELPLANYKNAEYAATIHLGSRQQQMNLVVNTMSSEVWVAGPDCPTNQCQ